MNSFKNLHELKKFSSVVRQNADCFGILTQDFAQSLSVIELRVARGILSAHENFVSVVREWELIIRKR